MNDIRTLVKKITYDFGTADPFTIADMLNIDVRYCPLGKMPLGKISYDDKGPIIILNESIKYSEQRYFTLAHEIGHYILHEGLPGYYTGVKFAKDSVELQANSFASGLMVILFMDEYDRLPATKSELERAYGLPR